MSSKPKAGETCKAQIQIGDISPQDCDFPFCGCFAMATKTIEALEECGWGKLPASALAAPQPSDRERAETAINPPPFRWHPTPEHYEAIMQSVMAEFAQVRAEATGKLREVLEAHQPLTTTGYPTEPLRCSCGWDKWNEQGWVAHMVAALGKGA